MFNSLKSLYAGDFENCKNSMLFPILRWISGYEKNIPVVEKCNEYFFFVKPEILKSIIFYGVKNKFITKYPKKQKQEYSFLLTDYIKPFLNYSYKDLSSINSILDEKLKSPEFKQKLALFFGLEPKEYKKLGLNFKEVQKNEFEKTHQQSLFNY